MFSAASKVNIFGALEFRAEGREQEDGVDGRPRSSISATHCIDEDSEESIDEESQRAAVGE